MEEFTFNAIGTINTPYKQKEGMPIQPVGAKGVKGTIQIKPEYANGLKDLDGFSHIILIYCFHKSRGYNLHVTPFMDDEPRGVFATRAPKRPNPIGLSTVKLLKIEGNMLYIENIDVLDGTPLLDIKPYIPYVDAWDTNKIGWLSNNDKLFDEKRSDSRFK